MHTLKTKGIAILLLMMQFCIWMATFKTEQATIQTTITLQGDHECDSLVEYWMEDYQKWSYKVVWYVYYENEADGKRYPAFCVEPEKEGVGTGHDAYQADVQKETDPGIWRILYKGYMGKTYTDYNLECDDDLYSATKIALHSYVENSVPTEKYILGTRPVDGNTVEDIQRRAEKVLAVAQSLYEYGIEGEEQYEEPIVQIVETQPGYTKIIDEQEYLIHTYTLQGNREIQEYQIQIQNFPDSTKVFINGLHIEVHIPTKAITESIQGTIQLTEIEMKTLPIYLCKSHVGGAQNYVTYTSGIETVEAQKKVEVDAHTASLCMKKINAKTGKPLPNVTFELTKEDGEGIGTYITDENGKIELNKLLPQTVYIQEIATVEGYRLEQEKRKVVLEWGKTASIICENEKIDIPPLPRTGY